jgi:hypothetical protein
MTNTITTDIVLRPATPAEQQILETLGLDEPGARIYDYHGDWRDPWRALATGRTPGGRS